MTISPNPDLRANQKARTRAALVAAAQELLGEGAPPTVAEAAERAKVSRATAYRYFPTQEALITEIAAVAPMAAPIEAALAKLPQASPEARLIALLDALNPVMFAEEVSMRAAVRGYLDIWLDARRRGETTPVVREGRRMRWLDEAVGPKAIGLDAGQWRRLRTALALTLGIEAVVVMRDVCRIEDPQEAQAALRWAAAALLRTGLEEAGLSPTGAGSPQGRTRPPHG